MGTKLRMVILPVLLLLVATSPAFGQFDENALYRIVAKHSGKCLSVANGPGAHANGDRVIQWDCIESETNQKWYIRRSGNGHFKIIASHSRKVLDVFGGIVSQGNGVIVHQWDDNKLDHQKWEITCVGDGIYKIVAKHSGKSLDINGGPAAIGNGPYAQQWDDWGGDNQRWIITRSLTDVPLHRATSRVCPSRTAQARLGVNVYTANTSLARTASFAINETIVLSIENRSGAPIHFKEGLNRERLISEEGLQSERSIASYWVSVFPSGICDPREVVIDNPDGTVTHVFLDYVPPTRVSQLQTANTISRRWVVPAPLGPGVYRLSFVYYRSSDIQGPESTVCSQTFVVR